MLLSLLYLLAPFSLGTVSAPSKTDQDVVQRLDKTLASLSDKKAWFMHVERQLPATSIPAWQRLQQRVPANSRQYAETSFMLAYYGVDYAANLCRLQRPYLLWHKDTTRWQREYPMLSDESESLTDIDNVWFAMNLLYLKRHDLKPIQTWMELGLDGCPAEGSDDALGELWQRHKTDMLLAVQSSEARLNNLAAALSFATMTGDPAKDRKGAQQFLTQIAPLLDAQNRQVALAARSLYPRLKSETQRWIRQEEKARQSPHPGKA